MSITLEWQRDYAYERLKQRLQCRCIRSSQRVESSVSSIVRTGFRRFFCIKWSVIALAKDEPNDSADIVFQRRFSEFSSAPEPIDGFSSLEATENAMSSVESVFVWPSAAYHSAGNGGYFLQRW